MMKDKEHKDWVKKIKAKNEELICVFSKIY